MKKILILSLFLHQSLFAGQKIIKNKNAYSANEANLKEIAIRKKMSSISSHIRELAPFIASEVEFSKSENKSIIQKHMEDISMLFNNMKTHPAIETLGLSINKGLMLEQLDQSISLLKTDKKSLSRAKFNAALNLCVHCHAQSPATVSGEKNKIFADKDIQSLKLNDYEKAELFFVTRDFDTAIKLYDKFLLNSKKSDDDELIYKALERELIYYIKFKKSFTEAKAHFEDLLKNDNFNPRISAEVKEWVKVLSGKKLWEDFDPAKTKEEEMEKFMRTFITDDEDGPIFTLSNSSEVYDLNLSSILLDYYNAHSETKLGAKILYWLATLEKRLSDDLFFSIGDYYLISCMEKYPKDPTAKDCYEAYLDELEINYLSKGKDFPPEIKARIKRLQKLIGYHEE